MTGISLSLFLATRELRSDWRSSICFVAAVVGILAPLLVVLALKNGVIGNMVGKLIEDPSNRELIAIGAGNHDAAFFADISQRPDVAFVIPRTRSINTSADLIRNTSVRKVERSVPLIPTGSGDPLLQAGTVVGQGEAHITTTLAEQLELVTGNTVEMIIQRNINGQLETARAVFEVTGIVPEDRFSRAAMFITLDDLLSVERFRDSKETNIDNWQAKGVPPQSYASLRLYVADLESLDQVQAALAAMGVQTRARAENAVLLLGFRDNLNILYTAVAVIASIGFWAAMAANLRSMVERQRVSFSFFSLLGMTRQARRWIPILQSLILVLGGIATTILLVLPTVSLINTYFGTAAGGAIATLGIIDLIGTLALGLATSISASAWAVYAVQNITPDEVLRHA